MKLAFLNETKPALTNYFNTLSKIFIAEWGEQNKRKRIIRQVP